MFYFEQVFVFCRLINKSVLKWFLLIIYPTVNRSKKRFSRNHPNRFLIKNRRLADAQYWTVTLPNWKMQPLEFSIKTLFLKILQYSWENTCVNFLRTPVLKNICVRLLLNCLYENIVWHFISGSLLKPSWLSNIAKKPIAFKQNF